MIRPTASVSRFVAIGTLFAAPSVATLAVLAATGAAAVGTVLIAAAVSAVLTAALVFLFYRDAVGIARYVHALAHGEAMSDRPPRPVSEIGQAMVAGIGRLHRADQRRQRNVQRQLDATAKLIETLNDPLVLIGPSRRVVRSNGAAREMLGDRVDGRDLAESVRHPDVLGAVDAVLRGDGMRTVEFVRPVPIEQVFQARVEPYDGVAEPNRDDPDDGPGASVSPFALLTFHDITAIRRSEQMRADFVANASHELRTPLSTLMGFIETLRGPARDDEEARDKFLTIMDEQASRMSRLVNDLLSLSRIELDEHKAPSGEVDLQAILKGVMATLELKAARKGMTLALDGEGGVPVVIGEPDQLTQVFQNLIDNAINYANANSQVRVVLRRSRARGSLRSGPSVAVSVVDQGDGIPKSHIPRLTERFYRVDPARSRALGGTGLGLAIVKHIVSRHRGRLTVESEVGKGSTFTVALPSLPVAEGAVAPEAPVQNVVPEAEPKQARISQN